MSASTSPSPKPASVLAAPRKSATKWLIAGGIVLVAAICAAAWYKSRHAVQGIPVTTEKAVVRTITQVVTATGKIQPEIEVKITSEVYGEIVELPFREGALVKKGDLIVKIKPDLYQAQFDQQTAAVNVAKSAAVRSQANLSKAALDLRRYQDLYDRKIASDSDYMLYKTAYDTAKADEVSALATVQQVGGSLKQAADALSKTAIYSPMDGTVSSRSCEVGERVQAATSFAGSEIMRVADLGNMEVRVTVNENDIPNV